MAYSKTNNTNNSNNTKQTSQPMQAPIPNDQKLDSDPTGKVDQIKPARYEVKVRITKSGEMHDYSFYCNEKIAKIYEQKIERKKRGRKIILSVEKVK